MGRHVLDAMNEYNHTLHGPAKIAEARLVEMLVDFHDVEEKEAGRLARSVPRARLATIGESLQEDGVGQFWCGVPQDTVARLEVNAESFAIDDLIALANKLAPR